MDMILYWVKDQTCQGHFFVHWGLRKTNKVNYFTRHHLPRHDTVMKHEYLCKANHSLSFVPLRGFINHVLGLTSTNMSDEPGGPKSECQEPGGPTSDCLALVLNNIFHIHNQNNITVPFNNIML